MIKTETPERIATIELARLDKERLAKKQTPK
jgi:hypothetical protein